MQARAEPVAFAVGAVGEDCFPAGGRDVVAAGVEYAAAAGERVDLPARVDAFERLAWCDFVRALTALEPRDERSDVYVGGVCGILGEGTQRSHRATINDSNSEAGQWTPTPALTTSTLKCLSSRPQSAVNRRGSKNNADVSCGANIRCLRNACSAARASRGWGYHSVCFPATLAAVQASGCRK